MVNPWYRDEKNAWQNLLSIIQAGPGRADKKEHREISCNQPRKRLFSQLSKYCLAHCLMLTLTTRRCPTPFGNRQCLFVSHHLSLTRIPHWRNLHPPPTNSEPVASQIHATSSPMNATTPQLSSPALLSGNDNGDTATDKRGRSAEPPFFSEKEAGEILALSNAVERERENGRASDLLQSYRL